MKTYASIGGNWANGSLMILYATASVAESDTTICREVRTYASHGRNPSEVELESNRVLSYAGGLAPGDDWSVARDVPAQGYPHILISFAYDADGDFFQRRLRYDPPNQLGDSGGFTAWTLGKTVDLDKLIAWCHRHVELHESFQCIALDVIPGTYGGNGAPSKAERERCMDESLANGDAMRAAGLKIMEVYHVFEPIEYLDRLVERRQPGEVIGLGGMVRRSNALKQEFCDAVFSRLKDHSGGWGTLIPAHGLGLSVRSKLAARYPWWSIDSSSWLAPALFGKGVTRGGKVLQTDDKRTSAPPMRSLYLTRVLEGWLHREAQLTRMWSDRGVRWRT